MIKLSGFGLGMFLLSLTACADSQEKFLVGGFAYQIPIEYLVVPPSYFEDKSLDSDVGMVALSFNHDKDFSDYFGDNAWLPKSPITAILYSNKGTGLTGISSSFSDIIDFSIGGKQVVEFENSYRVFDRDTRISWLALPKLHAGFDGDQVKGKWIAECIPLGGMKGSDKSRESIDIPTSCKINIKYDNAVLRLSTSEKNLLDNAEEIVSLVLKKMDSWKIN